MTYQPGDYEITSKYFSQDIQDNINKEKNKDNTNTKVDEAYKPIFEDIDSNWESATNSSNNTKAIGSSKESVKSQKTQASFKSQKKIAAEAGFSIREPVETYIEINSASPTTPTEHNLKENNSRSHLKVNIDDSVSWRNSNQYGTLKKGHTLSRPERQVTTRRRNIMRSENELPPIARTGNNYILFFK